MNKFPHSSFIWKGLDGTGVLTHFSPADTYCAQGTVKEVVFAVQNNKDKLYSNKSLLLYGNGDGGGGPLIPMIERIKRMQSVEGLPATIKLANPNDFYDELAQSKDLNTWQGELYFELHRGTYTSHCIIKKYNRMCEFLLRDIEMIYTFGYLLGLSTYPYAELDRLWKLTLLNQFHDVLPGSSIGLVYVDAIKAILINASSMKTWLRLEMGSKAVDLSF
jgi:alpha-mannosidase